MNETLEDSQSSLGASRASNIVHSSFTNINSPNPNKSIAESPFIASNSTGQFPRSMMVSGQQPQAMLPISSSVSNSNPPIDFTSLQPPPMETTLMSFASSQNQQIIQGEFITIFLFLTRKIQVSL